MASSQGVNHGSEFVVKLPRIVEASAQVEPHIPQELNIEADQELKVLLIDDNQDVTDSISMWFEMLGHQVEIASNGAQGLASAQSFHPDIILLDIGLPDMDGFQVARKLREQPAAQHTLIIALSGYIAHENNLGAETTSFDHYLMKPPKLNELRNLITEFQRTNSTLSDSFARHLGPSGV